ncbi:hypothetical protein A8L48_05800 [Rhizobium rhizogenes]|nr:MULTISPECIES: hypothetical protein [Rhizobium/Agrobacterium group]MCZ7444862.1 hypothetical protein [Rhizobium rhizogenes]OAM61872.1 hypothetical protein A8L48_05800 [Rhizobium rhizogenes]
MASGIVDKTVRDVVTLFGGKGRLLLDDAALSSRLPMCELIVDWYSADLGSIPVLALVSANDGGAFFCQLFLACSKALEDAAAARRNCAAQPVVIGFAGLA